MRNCDQLMFGLRQLDVTGEQTREQNKEQCFVSTKNNNNNNKKYDPLEWIVWPCPRWDKELKDTLENRRKKIK